MIRFFDAFCKLGPMSVPAFGQEFLASAALLRAMDHAGIDQALVHAPAAYEYDPVYGNRWLMEAVQDQPRLHPCWVLLPPATGEMPPPDNLVARMAAQNVRAARLCPSPLRNNFSLAPWSVGDLLAALAAARVPLFIDLDEIAWDELACMLADHPRLPVVLTAVTYRIDRYLYPLWQRHANLYVEVSGYQSYLGLEQIVARFGAERLLFGSAMPTFAAGAAVTHVALAQVEPADRERIAGGTLRRLLEAAHGA